MQFAFGEEEIMTCIIYSTLHWSYSDQMKVLKMSYINSLFPLKVDLFSWFLSETWKLNIILKILLILSTNGLSHLVRIPTWNIPPLWRV